MSMRGNGRDPLSLPPCEWANTELAWVQSVENSGVDVHGNHGIVRAAAV